MPQLTSSHQPTEYKHPISWLNSCYTNYNTSELAQATTNDNLTSPDGKNIPHETTAQERHPQKTAFNKKIHKRFK
jgi:hypothetical protein